MVDTKNPVEFVVTTRGEITPKVIPFENLFVLKPNIIAMTLLWNVNSYHVNIEQRLFILNGGRRIHINGFEDAENIRILYVRRNNLKMSVNSDGNGQPKEEKHEVSYLLGWEGEIKGETKQLMIHISPDGCNWYWREHR